MFMISSVCYLSFTYSLLLITIIIQLLLLLLLLLLIIIIIIIIIIKIIIIIFNVNFSYQRWSMSDINFPPVSMTLLSILADHNNDVVWMVSIFLLVFNSSILFPILSGPFQLHRLKFVPLSSFCSSVISIFWQELCNPLFSCFLLFYSVVN